MNVQFNTNQSWMLICTLWQTRLTILLANFSSPVDLFLWLSSKLRSKSVYNLHTVDLERRSPCLINKLTPIKWMNKWQFVKLNLYINAYIFITWFDLMEWNGKCMNKLHYKRLTNGGEEKLFSDESQLKWPNEWKINLSEFTGKLNSEKGVFYCRH